MAKAKTTKKNTEEVKALPKLAFMTLFDIRLDIDPIDEPSDSVLNYDISITPPSKSVEDKMAFRCEIVVGRKKPDAKENFIEVGASYGCLLDPNDFDDEALLDLAKLYAATTAWASFASLFSVMTQQMKVEFPPLPPFPGNVQIRPDHDSDDEDQVAVVED